MNNDESALLVFEGYPAVVGFDNRIEDRVLLYLQDMPGCGTQGPTIEVAYQKMANLVPQFLQHAREEKVELPEPSPAPLITIADMAWESSPPQSPENVVGDTGIIGGETARSSSIIYTVLTELR